MDSRRCTRHALVALALSLLATRAPAQFAPPNGGEPAPPRLEVERPAIDLGKVVRGRPGEAEFVLRNTGGSALHILSAKPG